MDENVEPIDFDVDADIIGLTGYVIHKQRIFELAAEFRRRGKFVVAGGPFASLCPEELRDKVDVLFVDEAEYTWPQFLKDYEAGQWQAEYRQDEKPSMHDSPLPRFDLLKIDQYRSMTIQFTRGCPFNCEFCDIIVMYGRRPRAKTVEQVMAEVREIHRLGARNIFVVDDNFIGNKKEAKQLLHAPSPSGRRRNDYPIEFMTEVTLNVVAGRRAAARSCGRRTSRTIFVGIESPRDREPRGDAQEAEPARGISRLGAPHPARRPRSHGRHDRRVRSRRHVDFRGAVPVHSGRPYSGVHDRLLNALPKTPLYKRLKEAGRLMAESVGDQFVFTNIIPQGMSTRELYEGYKQLLAAAVQPSQLPEARDAAHPQQGRADSRTSSWRANRTSASSPACSGPASSAPRRDVRG